MGRLSRADFFDLIRTKQAFDLASTFLRASSVAVFSDSSLYVAFKERVMARFGECESVSIVGSGNWFYSLNPEKDFGEFHDRSDIDVAIISYRQFCHYWEEMRVAHEKHFYLLSRRQRSDLLRNGENVYAGFISPNWIPNRPGAARYEFKRILNELSDISVGYRPVKALFFKSESEAANYYARGIYAAKRKLQ